MEVNIGRKGHRKQGWAIVAIIIVSVTIITAVAKNCYRHSGHSVTGMCILLPQNIHLLEKHEKMARTSIMYNVYVH